MKPSRKPPRHAVDISEEAGIRYLHFGSDWVQGAMRIARPWSLALEYTREMMFGLLLRPPSARPKKVLLIGLGAGSLAKFIYRHLPDCRVKAVEINPQVEFVAQQYFKLPWDPERLEVIIGCGADYLLSSREYFDAILVDGFGPDGRPGVLDTAPFYQACRARLSENGIFAVNLLREKGFNQSVERIREAFDGRMLTLPPTDSGNTIALAHAGEPVALSLDELKNRAESLRAATRLNLLPTLRRLKSTLGTADPRLIF